METRRIVIVTGLSGSGKSTAVNALEDMGFFCVDNLPVDLLPKLLELTESSGTELTRIALVIDLRQPKFFPRYSTILDSLDEAKTPVEILFLEARDDVIVRRYSETRRQHPLAVTGNLIDGIIRERHELSEIRERAEWVIDTSNLTVHELREEIRKLFGSVDGRELKIVVSSFGFGRGLPMEADLVLDVRFLPNPYFVEDLKAKDGRNADVAQWVISKETTKEFIAKLEDMLSFLLPLYMQEGKQYLTIAVGCTGGRHRSVVVAEHLSKFLLRKGYSRVEVKHRELSA
ncbi:MAG: RNase adapter RapZ [Thermodesulfobacteriota bacterium]